jgi:hypothetical protein
MCASVWIGVHRMRMGAGGGSGGHEPVVVVMVVVVIVVVVVVVVVAIVVVVLGKQIGRHSLGYIATCSCGCAQVHRCLPMLAQGSLCARVQG